jgi:putative methionine-R-sulfoxide reductase with GAF domain
MTPLADALQRAAERLRPHRQELVERWTGALAAAEPDPGPDVRSFCERGVDALLDRLSRGEAEEMLREEAAEAVSAAASGASFQDPVRVLGALERCCLGLLVKACPDPDALSDSLAALMELRGRRLDGLLRAHEQEAARRLSEAQDQAARAGERVVELQRLNDGLRRSDAQSQHRAEQIAMLSSVVHRIAPLRNSDQLLQEAADTIQSRMSHTYVAVVVLDNEGIVVGRWAGRRGVDRHGSGRTQGPAGGIIGRALRKRAPQVVADVAADPDYHVDVEGTRSEMVVPILEGGEVMGAIDFQSELPAAFDLDDVAVGETLAEFLVVALRNARLFAEAREREGEKR